MLDVLMLHLILTFVLIPTWLGEVLLKSSILYFNFQNNFFQSNHQFEFLCHPLERKVGRNNLSRPTKDLLNYTDSGDEGVIEKKGSGNLKIIWKSFAIGGQFFMNFDILLLGRFLVISLVSVTIFLMAFMGVGLFLLVRLVMISVW